MELLTTTEVAKKLGKSSARIRQIAPRVQGAIKKANGWLFPAGCLNDPAFNNPPGRPPGANNGNKKQYVVTYAKPGARYVAGSNKARTLRGAKTHTTKLHNRGYRSRIWVYQPPADGHKEHFYEINLTGEPTGHIRYMSQAKIF